MERSDALAPAPPVPPPSSPATAATAIPRARTAAADFNGHGAATLLSAAIGLAVLGVLAIVGDAFAGAARLLDFWNPTGPLSGVTTLSIIAWLLCWWVLGRAWAHRNVGRRWTTLASTLLVVAALLLTFPPFMDLLEGR